MNHKTVLAMFKPRSIFDGAVLISVVVVLPSMFFGGFGGSRDQVIRMLWNLGHFVFWGFVVLAVFERWPINTVKRAVVLLAAIFAMGVVVELIQSTIGRDADWRDVVSNMVGAAIALSWRCRGGWLIWISRAVFTSFFMIQCFKIIYVIVWQFRVENQLPLIAVFEQDQELDRWRGKIELADENVSEGKKSLKIYLNTDKYSGASLVSLPKNWSNYRYLLFDVFNPNNSSIEMTLRIHDREHYLSRNRYGDRFNKEYEIVSGWNSFKVDLEKVKNAPDSRAMDLRHMEALSLFAMSLPEPRVIYTDNWRLE